MENYEFVVVEGGDYFRREAESLRRTGDRLDRSVSVDSLPRSNPYSSLGSYYRPGPPPPPYPSSPPPVPPRSSRGHVPRTPPHRKPALLPEEPPYTDTHSPDVGDDVIDAERKPEPDLVEAHSRLPKSGTNHGILHLIVIILLWIFCCPFFCCYIVYHYCFSRQKGAPLGEDAFYTDLVGEDDGSVKDGVCNYSYEGGGEEDCEKYDLRGMRKPISTISGKQNGYLPYHTHMKLPPGSVPQTGGRFMRKNSCIGSPPDVIPTIDRRGNLVPDTSGEAGRPPVSVTAINKGFIPEDQLDKKQTNNDIDDYISHPNNRISQVTDDCLPYIETGNKPCIPIRRPLLDGRYMTSQATLYPWQGAVPGVIPSGYSPAIYGTVGDVTRQRLSSNSSVSSLLLDRYFLMVNFPSSSSDMSFKDDQRARALVFRSFMESHVGYKKFPDKNRFDCAEVHTWREMNHVIREFLLDKSKLAREATIIMNGHGNKEGMILKSEPVPYNINVFISRVRVSMTLTHDVLGLSTPLRVRLVFAQCYGHLYSAEGHARLTIRALSRNSVAEEKTHLLLKRVPVAETPGESKIVAAKHRELNKFMQADLSHVSPSHKTSHAPQQCRI